MSDKSVAVQPTAHAGCYNINMTENTADISTEQKIQRLMGFLKVLKTRHILISAAHDKDLVSQSRLPLSNDLSRMHLEYSASVVELNKHIQEMQLFEVAWETAVDGALAHDILNCRSGDLPINDSIKLKERKLTEQILSFTDRSHKCSQLLGEYDELYRLWLEKRVVLGEATCRAKREASRGEPVEEEEGDPSQEAQRRLYAKQQRKLGKLNTMVAMVHILLDASKTGFNEFPELIAISERWQEVPVLQYLQQDY